MVGVTRCQCVSSGLGWLSVSDNQAATRATWWCCVEMLQQPAWKAALCSLSVLYVWYSGREGAGGDLRDGVLCKGQILHQHVQAFVIFIQELSHPPEGTKTQFNNSTALFNGIGMCLWIIQKLGACLPREARHPLLPCRVLLHSVEVLHSSIVQWNMF